MNMKKIAVEVIWNTEQTSIIGYKEIDANTLSMIYKEDGSFEWVQYANDYSKRRVLTRCKILTNF
jgi:hypothetical protein